MSEKIALPKAVW